MISILHFHIFSANSTDGDNASRALLAHFATSRRTRARRGDNDEDECDGEIVAHRYATFLCSWDDSLVGQLTMKPAHRVQ